MTETETTGSVENLKISEIEIEDNLNPRGTVTEQSVKNLVNSIRQDGVLQAILVRRVNGSLRLIAGHRRLIAARLAGLDQIPAQIRKETSDEDARALAFDENEQRQDMVPMARAIALKNQVKRFGGVKQVAERRSLNTRQVNTLVKMCELPEPIQKIALEHRQFTPDLTESLLRVTTVPGGGPVARFLAGHAMKNEDTYRQVRDQLPEMLDQIVNYRRTAQSEKERNSVPYVEQINRLPLTALFDGEQLNTLTARALAIHNVFREPWQTSSRTGITVHGTQPWEHREITVEISLTGESADRLRAAGSALIITDSRERTTIHLFDREVVESEVEQIIETGERIAAGELKEREADAKKRAAAAGGTIEDGADPVKEQRRVERETAKKEAARARTENEQIGERLLKRGSRPLAKKDQLELIRVMAKATVRQDDRLAAGGMRLCFNAWKQVETRTLKSGAEREKVTYMEPEQAEKRLIESLDNAKTQDEILRIMFEALVAATFADQTELPQSKRVLRRDLNPISRFGRAEMRVIDRLAKGMLPEQAEKIRVASVEAGYNTNHGYGHRR